MDGPLVSVAIWFRPASLLLSPTLFFLFACEQWPRYLYLEEIEGTEELPPRYAFEDETLGSDRKSLQDLEDLAPGGSVVVYGYAFNCGYDSDASHFDWPEWPELPFDNNGDGEIDSYEPDRTGWFSGDVDFFKVTADDLGSLNVQLEWQNAPSGNNTSDEEDKESSWSTETDLDFVVFTLDTFDGGAGSVESDAGFDSQYPAVTDPQVFMDANQPLVVAVACHHSVASDYTLTLALSSVEAVE